MRTRKVSELPIRVMATIAIVIALAGAGSATAQCTPNQYTYTFTSYCSYPIWIGQTANASNGQSYPPEGGNWALAPACTADDQCASGKICQDGQCSCSTDKDCPGKATCAGGLCSTTATFCMPKTWTSGTFWPRTGCTVETDQDPELEIAAKLLNCETGQCTPSGSTKGLLDCGVGITSPTNPVTQFEVSSIPSSANYDVSLVAGYNVEMKVTPVGGSYTVPGEPVGSKLVSCFWAGCTSDVTCPTSLQGDDGCLDPCTQCQQQSPPSLECSTQLSATAPTKSCGGSQGSAPTYQDMYCAQSFADSVTQASSNQGTPTAFSQADCFPNTTFVVPTFTSGYSPHQDQGVCLYIDPPQSTIAGFNDYGWYDAKSKTTKKCGDKSTPDGTPCGGYLTGPVYPNALGYTCQTATYQDSLKKTQTAHLCLPPTTSGLGNCATDGTTPLYSAVGGLFNPAWLAAGLKAGGGTTPYYATFKAACPRAYTWQYDDAASGFGCDALPTPKGKPLSGFDVTFCGSAKK